jgi:diguanylate cyclase (GGDEF)-like protein
VITPILLCSLYLALNLYSRVVTPAVLLDPAPLHLVNCLNVTIIFMVLSVFAHKYRVAVRSAERSLREANHRLDLLAATDPLTGLLNRRDMRRRISDEMRRLRRGGDPFVLVMSDIDNFKSFNDRHGHDCGDFALVSVASLLRSCLRKQDHVARWGGEEFLLLLPGTSLDEGASVAERIRVTIEEASLLYEGSGLSITMTFGVAVCDRPQSAEDCIRAADRALYAAKREAGNCVILAGHEATVERASLLRARVDARPVASPAEPVGAQPLH